jgi:hypothetical protein
MKYIKLFENIDWDWVDEENEPISYKFNKLEEEILKNNFPIIIRIHIKYHDELIKLLLYYKLFDNMLISNHIYNQYKLKNILYFYIREKEIGYNPDNDYTIIYNKNNYPNIEIIEII